MSDLAKTEDFPAGTTVTLQTASLIQAVNTTPTHVVMPDGERFDFPVTTAQLDEWKARQG